MDRKDTFPKIMRCFHMIGIILILTAYIAIYTMDFFPWDSIMHNLVFQVHMFAWILVLFFVIPRFIVARINHKNIPQINPPLSKINKFFLELGHIFMYWWMILIPISGLLLISSQTWNISILGYQIPWLVSENTDSLRTYRELHEILWTIGLFLIWWHAFISLFHHFKIKDNTIIRMFPWVKQREK